MTFSVSSLYVVRWYHDRGTGKDLIESDFGLIEVLSLNLPEGAEENHERHQ
jgi:hypothetical protein